MCDRLDSAEIIARWRDWLTAADLSPHTIRLDSYGAVRFLSEVVGGHPEGAKKLAAETEGPPSAG